QLASHGFSVASPASESDRGGHVALEHPDGWRICQALKAAGVIPDFRRPNVIRLAPSPLYTTFAECAEAIMRLQKIILTRAHENFPSDPSLVP
ncbi:MAG: kynU, partial [Verrucomicrobia bacterium]|nr:kynU [Verrucomicrobiota bacterium]